jgi:hypothetical protein
MSEFSGMILHCGTNGGVSPEVAEYPWKRRSIPGSGGVSPEAAESCQDPRVRLSIELMVLDALIGE